MKFAAVLLYAVGLITAGAGVARAEPRDVEQIYLETCVSRSQKAVSRPSMLVRVGEIGKMTFAGDDTEPPRLGLTYEVEPRSSSAFSVAVTALVGGEQVATGMLSFTRDQGVAATLEGGGYSWQVMANLLTPDFLRRRLECAGRCPERCTVDPGLPARQGFESPLNCGVGVSRGAPRPREPRVTGR
jgi:hypothetical protein